MASGEDPVSRLTIGMTRKLAAILSADVAEYSRLMGEDEEATIRTVTAYREVIATLVQQHRGRVVDSPGDNLLAEFPSVVDTVQCAVAIQRELHARNTALPLPRRMQFRLGINLGDVIAEGERIYGDGVNIAARLESLAEAGGICISGTVYDQIGTRLALRYEFLGERTVKNITRPVRVYRVRAEPGGAALPVIQRKPSAATSRLRGGLVAVALLALLGGGVSVWQLVSRPLSPLPDKPSIAVLPFVNMSGDPEQEYFSDGMTEDLITELSRLAGLFIIARNSVFTYKGKTVKPEQVSRELGVRYTLEGSVRKANDRIRVSAQLVDAARGYQVWAERYDRGLQDIFAVQEDIARRITRAMAVQLTAEETEHVGRPYTNDVTAWEYFKRGTELSRRFTKEANAHARGLFENAIRLDPKFARAYANLAATYRHDWIFGWAEGEDLPKAKALALEKAKKAVDLADAEEEPKPSVPYVNQQMAYVRMYRKDFVEAMAAAKKTVERDRNYADGYAALAAIQLYQDDPDGAIANMRIAIHLNPKYPASYPYYLGQAYYVKGQHEVAKEYLLEALRSNPNFRPARAYLVAVYIAQSQREQEEGRAEEAQALEDQAKREMAILKRMGRRYDLFTETERVAPYKTSAIADRLLAAWERAGANDP
jgi:adenylate cyclase